VVLVRPSPFLRDYMVSSARIMIGTPSPCYLSLAAIPALYKGPKCLQVWFMIYFLLVSSKICSTNIWICVVTFLQHLSLKLSTDLCSWFQQFVVSYRHIELIQSLPELGFHAHEENHV
jgi:hypothetical protein